MHLRRPANRDLPALSALCLRSKAWWGYDAAFMDACRGELTLTAGELATSDLIMAEIRGQAAGLAQVTRGANPADLLKLFVDPPFIGTGLGRLLFDWAAGTARAQGADALTIEADPGARPFYERMGARLVGEAPSGSIPGRMLPLLEFRF